MSLHAAAAWSSEVMGSILPCVVRPAAQRTFNARWAAAQAEELVVPVAPTPEGGVPLPLAEQGAALDLAAAGTEVADRWRGDPAEGGAAVRRLTAVGDPGVEEVLNVAVEVAATTGLLALEEVRHAPDPHQAAERCLSAVPSFVLAGLAGFRRRAVNVPRGARAHRGAAAGPRRKL